MKPYVLWLSLLAVAAACVGDAAPLGSDVSGSAAASFELNRELAPVAGATLAVEAAQAMDPVLPMAAQPFPKGLTGELVFQSDRDGATRIYAVDLATGKVRRVGPAGDWFDEEPQWSPDGRRIAFASTRAEKGNLDIFVLDADGSNLVRVTNHPESEQGPAWAGDGQSLFFTGTRDRRAEIYRVWLADKRVERVTSGFDRAIMPAASPDGRYLAWAAPAATGFQIHLLDLHAGTRRQITSGGGACHPNFAPDSQELAFVRLDRDPSRLEVLRETGGRVVMADPKMWSYYPDYSSDGRYLAFSVSPEHHRGEDWDLAIMEYARPGSFVRLTSGPGNDRVPDFRPTVR